MCEQKRRAFRECHTDLTVVGGERKPSRGWQGRRELSRRGQQGNIRDGGKRNFRDEKKRNFRDGGKATSWMGRQGNIWDAASVVRKYPDRSRNVKGGRYTQKRKLGRTCGRTSLGLRPPVGITTMISP
jgi:hypothetical protein